MKKLILPGLMLVASLACRAQENIFFFGYGKTLVSKDSSTTSITVAINKTPGGTAGPGNYYLVNHILPGDPGAITSSR